MLTAGGDDFLSLLADWSSKLGALNSGANIGNFLPTYLPPNLGNIIPTHLPPNLVNILPTYLPPNIGNILPTYLPPKIGNILPTYLPPNLGNIVTHLSSHAHWRQCDQMADF